MRINILTDNRKSWILPFVDTLKDTISQRHEVKHCFNSEEIVKGDLLILLSCEKILSSKYLSLNLKNIVVHPSKLPKGKGWSPLAWQILEGRNRIPITLFEASEAVDSGKIYIQDFIELKGHELNNEIKKKQGERTIGMVINFINNIDNFNGTEQTGEESFYEKRTPRDSELNISKSIEEQFNLLRVVDNDRYPAFFIKGGHKYILRISREVINE